VLKAVPDPHRFGVAELDADGRVIGFEEKPEHPKSDRIPIGVYLFRPDVFDVLHELRPSARGEFEITDVLNHYVERGTLIAHDFAGEWMDAGTIESLLAANRFGATFASERPVDASGRIAEVDAEAVDPSTVRP
jgi:glucose-1-phosphate thymidylyltransferase